MKRLVQVRLLLLCTARCAAALPSGTLSIMSYNIMDSGFADESGRYDPVGDRVTKNGTGNLTNFMRSQSPFVDVLGIVETGAWTANGSANHPGYLQIARDWGYQHVHVRGNCAIMSHAALTVVDEPNVGLSTIVARVQNTTFIVTSMSSLSSATKYEAFKSMADYVMANYAQEPLIVMGDLNSVSPQDAARYNETLLCGNGTYDPISQTGEYVENYCLEQQVTGSSSALAWEETTGIKWCSGRDCLIDGTGQCGEAQADLYGAGVDNNCVILPRSASQVDWVAACERACAAAHACAGFTLYPANTTESGAPEACFRSDCSSKPIDAASAARCYEKRSKWALDFRPMGTLLNNSDLVDLCFVAGGFYDVDVDNLAYRTSQCAFSNPTLLIHMTGRYSDNYAGSHAHDHATAKIDYILANRKMLQLNRFHHTNVITTFQADGCSDHYPIEATFMT